MTLTDGSLVNNGTSTFHCLIGNTTAISGQSSRKTLTMCPTLIQHT